MPIHISILYRHTYCMSVSEWLIWPAKRVKLVQVRCYHASRWDAITLAPCPWIFQPIVLWGRSGDVSGSPILTALHATQGPNPSVCQTPPFAKPSVTVHFQQGVCSPSLHTISQLFTLCMYIIMSCSGWNEKKMVQMYAISIFDTLVLGGSICPHSGCWSWYCRLPLHSCTAHHDRRGFFSVCGLAATVMWLDRSPSQGIHPFPIPS